MIKKCVEIRTNGFIIKSDLNAERIINPWSFFGIFPNPGVSLTYSQQPISRARWGRRFEHGKSVSTVNR